MCFVCSEVPFTASCSAHLTSTFLFVSPKYVSPQLHSPLYITLCTCEILSLRGKKFLILDVIQKYENVMTFLVNEFNLLMHLCMYNSFSGQ